jgi:hypothetical protein
MDQSIFRNLPMSGFMQTMLPVPVTHLVLARLLLL